MNRNTAGLHLRRLARTAHARRRLRAVQAFVAGDITGWSAPRIAASFEADAGAPGGPTWAEVVAAWHVAADRCRAAYDLTGAAAALDRAVVILEATNDESLRSTWLCETLTLRGDTRRLMADHQGAAEDLSGALKAARGDARRAGVWNALGILAKDEGRFDDAEWWYQQALSIPVARADSDRSVATMLHNLAGLDQARGAYESGERYIRRALKVRSKPPVDQGALLGDRGVLAAILSAQRRDEEAEPLLRELIEDWSRMRGPHHYEVAHCRHHLGVLLARNGRPEEARRELADALAILTDALGATHPQTRAVVEALRALTG